MKNLLLFFVFPLLSNSQIGEFQSIGSLVTYVVSCPCKLFKYYEDDKIFYFCKDIENNTEYLIKEFKHKNRMDLILNTLDKNIYKDHGKESDSIIINHKKKSLNNYLKKNPNGKTIEFMSNEAVITNNPLEKKLFFSDKDFIVSYEIIVSGKNSSIVSDFFNKSINSLMLKSENFKRIF